MQIKDGFAEGKDLVVTVMSAMGEEQICALKDIGPKIKDHYSTSHNYFIHTSNVVLVFGHVSKNNFRASGKGKGKKESALLIPGE